jgi:hypothetical protein
MGIVLLKGLVLITVLPFLLGAIFVSFKIGFNDTVAWIITSSSLSTAIYLFIRYRDNV